jgi:hypothetical protein
LVWKVCAPESEEALNLGITRARIVWVGAKTESGRGRMGAKNGARPERETAHLSLCGKTATDEARRAVCVLLFRSTRWKTAKSCRSRQDLKKKS